ncbi:hypothetical protein SO802_026292 [Lithocarpus litseifolius]|uniref:CCHC-type domain-containing protein n=1 Tax=Lithocarpus litseifolius TaxID=425828 RepID=A0AAW2C1T7_9ROSI
MEGLMKHWSNLSLNEREDGTLKLTKDRSTSETILAAKFFTKRALNTEAVIRTFNPLWRYKNGFEVRTAGNHILLFVFDNKEEAEKILSLQPWSFDKHLVVLRHYDNATPIRELNFNKVPMWVQIHDIPLPFLNRGVAEELCTAVGEVCKDTKLSEMDGGHYFRVKTTVDITFPLCRGRKISLENGATGWVNFKYERLPILCYWCGHLDHIDKDCDRWIESNGSLSPEDREYGPWIRASPSVMLRKTVIKVPGYYEALKKERGLKTKNQEDSPAANPSGLNSVTQISATTQMNPHTSFSDTQNVCLLQGDSATNGLGRQVETAVSPPGLNSARPDLGEEEGADWVQASDMETVETEAQITPESQNDSTLLNMESVVPVYGVMNEQNLTFLCDNK